MIRLTSVIFVLRFSVNPSFGPRTIFSLSVVDTLRFFKPAGLRNNCFGCTLHEKGGFTVRYCRYNKVKITFRTYFADLQDIIDYAFAACIRILLLPSLTDAL